MSTLDLALAAALACTNAAWLYAYRRLAKKHLETLGALWAQMLGH